MHALHWHYGAQTIREMSLWPKGVWFRILSGLTRARACK